MLVTHVNLSFGYARLGLGLCAAVIMAAMASCDRPEPSDSSSTLTPAQQAIAALRQSLQGDGKWQGGAMRIETPAIHVEPDGSLVLNGQADRDVTMSRLDPATDAVQVQFHARQIRYIPLNQTTVACRLYDVQTTNPASGQAIRVAELHFEFAAETLAP